MKKEINLKFLIVELKNIYKLMNLGYDRVKLLQNIDNVIHDLEEMEDKKEYKKPEIIANLPFPFCFQSKQDDNLSALIEALIILLKYGNPISPTRCKDYIMYININPEKVSSEDLKRLREFDIVPDDEGGPMFMSVRFGD